jgi:signal transduction histidine kinase
MTSSLPQILVRGDETGLNQIVLNLVVNARDAMPDGGTAAIDMGIVELSDPLAPALGIMPGPYASLSVADGGQGIDPEVVPHLFEPFFTSKPPEKGTGLGLSVVYGIVKGLGGGIEVHSQVGRGATFTIYLPMVADAK